MAAQLATPALVGNSSETSINSLCLFGACRGAKGYEQSWIPELSMTPISLCQSDPLPGKKLGFVFPVPQKEDHTLVALWSSTFHPLMMKPNPVPYQRQELLERWWWEMMCLWLQGMERLHCLIFQPFYWNIIHTEESIQIINAQLGVDGRAKFTLALGSNIFSWTVKPLIEQELRTYLSHLLVYSSQPAVD